MRIKVYVSTRFTSRELRCTDDVSANDNRQDGVDNDAVFQLLEAFHVEHIELYG